MSTWKKSPPSPRSVRSRAEAGALVDALFDDEPENKSELAAALAGVDPDVARERLIARLRLPSLERWQAMMAAGALEIVDAYPARDELGAIAGDRSLPEHARYAAVRAIQGLDGPALDALLPTLSEAAHEALLDLPMVEMVARVHEDPEVAHQVTEALCAIDPETRPLWLAHLAQVRRRVGVRAADLYRYALAEPTVAGDERLREPMLLALIEEADEAGSALLQALRAKAPKALRAPFQVALIKLETARVAGGGKSTAPKGGGGVVEAFASNPDGQGAIVVFMSFANPDGSFTLANVCLRLTEDLRNGFVEPRATRADRARMVDGFSDDGSIVLVPAPPGEVARLVEEAAARTMTLRGSIPADVRRAVEYFARVPAVEAPPVVPARSIATETLPAIFRRPLHRYWFFDDADLARFGASGLRPGAAAAARDGALAALGRSPMRARVVAMARYMSRWASWRGDAGEAADWTTLAEGAERDFATSPLATIMAVLTLDPLVFREGARSPSRSMPEADAAGGMEAFGVRFPALAATETRTIITRGNPAIPDDAYGLLEFYCTDRGCDCDRVLLKAIAQSDGREVMTVGHAFSATGRRFSGGLPRTYIDPMHPRAPFAEALFTVVEQTLLNDAAYHQRLQGHYRMVKQAIGPTQVRRVGPKVGPNDRCPCGSGKKYKKCCGAKGGR